MFRFVSFQARADLSQTHASTPYEILKGLYDNASKPGSFIDFDLTSVVGSNQHCVRAGISYPKTMPEYFFHPTITSSRKPSAGLAFFEGNSNRDVILVTTSSIIQRNIIVDAFDNQVVASDANDLILNFSKENGFPPVPLQIKICSSGVILPFLATT